MSKKKNTLNDLEEFLKMQASALVTPASLTEKVKEPAAPVKTEIRPSAKDLIDQPSHESGSELNLFNALKKLATTDKKAFYDLLIAVTEKMPNRSKEDTLLINTALYLKGGANWKEVVRDYWKK